MDVRPRLLAWRWLLFALPLCLFVLHLSLLLLLLFTLPAAQPVPRGCYCLGQVDAQPGIRLRQRNGAVGALTVAGWQHF